MIRRFRPTAGPDARPTLQVSASRNAPAPVKRRQFLAPISFFLSFFLKKVVLSSVHNHHFV